jgi:uncharacterized protein (TIGR02145 family)
MRNVIANAKGACYELCVVVAISLVLGVFLSACSGEGGNFTNPNDEELAALSSAEGQGSSSSKTSGTGVSSSVTLNGASAESNGSSSSEQDVKSGSSENLPGSSSSAEENGYSSSSVTLATPCKTETEDNCEYGELIDERDGQIYKTVKIGAQWWMAENLNYADSIKTPILQERNWCYNNEPDSCSKYGRLYTWTAAIDSVKIATDSERPCFCSSEWLCYNSDRRRCVLPDTVPGICPNGWHLPNSREWSVLMDAVGGKLTSGKVLRSQSGWYSNGDWYDDKGLDSFGFNALPAGQMSCPPDSCFFNDVEEHAYFWTSAEYNSNSSQAYCMNLWYASRDGWLSERPKKYGHSIRCVKD